MSSNFKQSFTLQAIKGQLDRERAKNKALMKRLKSDDSTKSNGDIIWIQKDQNRNDIRPPTATAAMQPSPVIASPKATASVSDSRPATTTALAYSAKADRDPNERKIKLLNKTVKSLRADIAHLQRENYNMRQVTFIRTDRVNIMNPK